MWTAVNLSWHKTLLVLLFCWSSRAAQVTRYIDDSLGDTATGFKPIYNPSGSWANQMCSGCPIQPDPSFAYDGTWTAATYTPQIQNLSITLQFTGTEIWVYFILPNANQHGTSITTNTFVEFLMDGTYICNYTHTPDMSTYNMNYNSTVFHMYKMGNTPHQLIISTNNVPYNAYINFDYAMYLTDTADSSTTAPLYSTINPSSSLSGAVPASTLTTQPAAETQSGLTPNSSPPVVIPSNQGNSQTTSSSSSSSTSSSSSRPPVTIIVGGVFGALAATIIVLLSFLLVRLKKSKESAFLKPTTVGSPSRPTSDDNETGTHLPWQSAVFSDTTEPFGNLPVGLAAGVAASTNSSSPAFAHSHSRSASDYTSAPTPTPALLPIGTPLSSDREKIRAIRQTEIDEQLNSARREMENLAARQSMPPPPNAAGRPAPTDQEMEALREQVRMLTGQIEHLNRERQSDWALGLSDEAPPAYA